MRLEPQHYVVVPPGANRVLSLPLDVVILVRV